MVNFNTFDWVYIFSVANALNPLKKYNGFRFICSHVLEKTIEESSGRQFTYVGIKEDGVDYKEVNSGTRWESKEIKGMFNKKGGTTQIILKNFHGNQTNINQTFDYILLLDTEKMTAGYAKYKGASKNMTVKSSTINTKIDFSDITFICKNVQTIQINKWKIMRLFVKVIWEYL